MPTTPRYQILVYDSDYNVQQNGSDVNGAVADVAIIAGSYNRRISGDESLSFEILEQHADSSLFVDGSGNRLLSRKLELVKTDLNGVALWTRAFRINNIRAARSGSVYTYQIEAEHFSVHLGRQIHEFWGDLVDQTPTTLMNQILAGSWSVGTVTPTALQTMTFNSNTRLFDLRELESLTGYELDFTTVAGNPSTLEVNLVRIGDQASTSVIEFGTNIQNIQHENILPEGNVIYGFGGESPRGEPMTLRNHTHRVTAIASNTITLDTDKVVSTDGDYVGYTLRKIDPKLFPPANGSLDTTTITASNKQVGGNDQLTLGDATGLVVDGKVAIGDPPTPVVIDQTSIDTYDPQENEVRDESIGEVINLVGPAKFSALSGTYDGNGVCEGADANGWSIVVNPTTAENTDTSKISHGSRSQKVTVGSFTTTPGAPTVTKESPNGDIRGELSGTYTYKQAWITTDGFGLLSIASASNTVSNQRLKIDRNAADPGGHVIGWALFRNKDGAPSTYYKIAEIDINTTTFYDTFADTMLSETAPTDADEAAGGQGVEIDFTAEVDSAYACVVYVFVENGSVRVELEAGDVFPDDSMDPTKRGTPRVTSLDEFRIVMQGLNATDTIGKLRVLANGGDGTDTVFYVDAVMIVKSAYAPDPNLFVADNSATELWYKCFDKLQELKDAIVRTSFDIVDFWEAGIGSNRFEVGDKISVTDNDLGISETVRIMAKEVDIKNPQSANFEIQNAVRRFPDREKERQRRERKLSSAQRRTSARDFDGTNDDSDSSREPVMIVSRVN